MNDNKKLIEYLSGFASEERVKKFHDVINNRTRHITIVLEDIYQPHNASAVLRSCDCFGIQDVHIIENKNQYTVNQDIALGSSKWLNLIKYKNHPNNTLACINDLKKKGYRIVATSPHKEDNIIQELDITSKTALVFGTELKGISDEVMQHADGFVKIPMYGFTESFNISVSAALCLHTLVHKLHHSDIHWQLDDQEKEQVMTEWLRNSINRSDLIEEEFYKSNSGNRKEQGD
ncbi:MAG: RNA methyltransferase [Bacteroidia bacterium]|nr:RNA methyltransferase [Bacteroidia bacterium]